MVEMPARPWFVPKSHGYGATPITWEGWALVLAFVAALTLAAWLIIARPIQAGQGLGFGRIAAFLLVDLLLMAGLIWVARAKSSAEWRWRWGEDRR